MSTGINRKVLLASLSVILTVSTVAVYWPVIGYEFVNFDDNIYVYENPHVRDGLTRDSLRWALTADLFSDSPHADFWAPVTFLSHLLVAEFFGLDPSAHHATNLVLHLLNTLLLFWVLNRMTRQIWPGAFVAALFAIHPLHVESVAWVTERKDLLSAFFFMLALRAYVRYTERPGFAGYLLVMSVFALGLMAKPMIVTLPFVLLLLDYWPLKRLSFENTARNEGRLTWNSAIREKIPLFLLATAFGLLTIFTVGRGETLGSLHAYPLGTRVANAAVSYATYVRKMMWPSDLAVLYPHPGNALSSWQVMGSGFFLLVVTLLVFRNFNGRPHLAIGWLWYLGTMMPVAGLVQAGRQAMADRYCYIPLIGLFIMIAWEAATVLERHPRLKTLMAIAGTVTALVMLGWTKQQVTYWKNSVTLFEHSLSVTKNNYILHNNLGLALSGESATREAIDHYREAIRIKPDYIKAHNNLGVAYKTLGRFQDAMIEFQTAVGISPTAREPRKNLAYVYARLGRYEDAVTEYQNVLDLDPNDALAVYNLGVAHQKLGRLAEARIQYTRALMMDPDLQTARKALQSLPPQGAERD